MKHVFTCVSHCLSSNQISSGAISFLPRRFPRFVMVHLLLLNTVNFCMSQEACCLWFPSSWLLEIAMRSTFFLVVLGIAPRVSCMLGQASAIKTSGFSSSKILLPCLLAYIVFREMSTVILLNLKVLFFFGWFL